MGTPLDILATTLILVNTFVALLVNVMCNTYTSTNCIAIASVTLSLLWLSITTIIMIIMIIIMLIITTVMLYYVFMCLSIMYCYYNLFFITAYLTTQITTPTPTTEPSV